ncbi:MarR family winged helix-turn-helix transcriptional regulator [Vibrio gangliei]|uniref:MarR family winged helix-turn-helix transcriptional regulator n=1 Tax=Vibrio gangliei TaxID=2077090 RepID=UPI0013009CFD|nr:MarR family transcriptional regulator [Vibrio gangliei]
MADKITVSELLSLGSITERNRLPFEGMTLRLHRISDYLKADVQQHLAPYQLQQADFSILISLYRQGKPYNTSPTLLYKTMLFSSGGLTKVLARVEEKQLIERIDNPEDKRSKLVQLTEIGLQTIESILDKLQQSRQQKLSCLNAQEQKQFEELLTKILNDWEG